MMPWIPSPRPPLGLYIHNFPASGMSRQCELISPPFPTYQVLAPVPVTFPEALQSEDFWVSHFQHYGMLRLKPATASYKMRGDPKSMWIVLRDSDDLEALVQPHHTGRTLAALLEMTPEERIKQTQAMISEEITELQAAIEKRRIVLSLASCAYPAFSSRIGSVRLCFKTISAVIVSSFTFLLPGT